MTSTTTGRTARRNAFTRTTANTAAAIPVAACLALSLGGCGSDDGGGSNTPVVDHNTRPAYVVGAVPS